MSDSRVAILGLGLIGSIWKDHYQQAGVLAGCWNRTPKPDESCWCSEAVECLERASLIHLCLYDPDSVESVLGELRQNLQSHHVIIQSTTIDPVQAERFRSMVEATGAGYVEAPFTGSKPAAQERKTVFFLGGDASPIKKARVVLELLSAQIFTFETPAQAASIKLAMNLQIAGITQALCEAVAISRKAGISDDSFFEVMKMNVSWSGLAALKEPKIRASDYTPQFSIKNLLKDMRLAQETLSDGNLPLLAMAVEQLAAADKAGFSEDDFLSLYRLLK